MLDAYEKMIGLDLADLAVDGCTTKAVCGGECAGPSPVDRAKGGFKRSQLTDGAGIPIAAVSAPANAVDPTLLTATLDAIKDFQPLPPHVTVHLDAGYDHRPARDALAERDLHEQIAHRGEPAPIQVGRRWVVERTHAWLNDFGNSVAAPNDAATASTPTSASPPRSSPSVRSAGPPGTSTAGTPDHDHHAPDDLLAGTPSCPRSIASESA